MNRQFSVVRLMRLLPVMLGLLSLWGVPVSHGQTTSITSSGLNTVVTPSAGAPVPTYNITGGTRPGNGPNLFHSFGDFSVGTNNVARFLNDSGLATSNILSRVTGGHVSNIFGEINTANFPGANLYLMNPAGVMFGATASLNVSGSVYVSTADYLRLADGLRFNAVPGPQDALLSQAPVTAFGFLGPTPQGISVQGSTLQVPAGKTLSFIGGDINIGGGHLAASGPTTANGGQVEIVSVASRGEAQVGSSGEPSVSGFGRLGNVRLSDGASVGVNGATGGTVVLRAGKLVVDNSKVTASGVEGGGKISIEARDGAVLRNSPIALDVSGSNPLGIAAAGGQVTIHAGQLQLNNTGIKATGSEGGAVVINATEAVRMEASRVDTGAVVSSGIVAPGDHQAGNINITAGDSVRLLSGTVLASDNAAPSGKAGNIVIETGKNFVSEASTLSTRSVQDATGGLQTAQGGTVVINARELVRLDGSRIDTGVSFAGGQAGNINIQAGGSVQLLNGTALVSDSKGTLHPRGGTVAIDAKGSVLIERSQIDTSAVAIGSTATAGSISVRAGELVQLINGSALTSESNGPNVQAGTISAYAGRNVIVDGSQVSTHVHGGSVGEPGQISVKAGDSVRVRNGSSISADGALGGESPRVQAGNIAMEAGRNVVAEGSRISADAQGGDGGHITLKAGDSVRVVNGTIQADALGGPGGPNAGRIGIQAGGNVVVDGSHVTADALPTGQAGQVSIAAEGSVRLVNGTVVSASSTSLGPAGKIGINAGGGVLVDASRLSTEAGAGQAGQISITAGDSVRLHNATVLASAVDGDGGNIAIGTGKNFVSEASILSARSVQDAMSGFKPAGGGTVAINAKELVRLDGSRIDTGVTAVGIGVVHAGDISIQAGDSVHLFNGTALMSDAKALDFGHGGTVSINVNHTVLMEGSRVDTSALGATSTATAGSILIQAGDSVRLLRDTALTSESRGTDVNPGKIAVEAGRNIIVDGSRLSATYNGINFFGSGQVSLTAGDSVRLLHGTSISTGGTFDVSEVPTKITITAGGNVLVDASQISAETSGPGGHGGQIGISAGQSVRLLNGSRLSVNRGGLGTGPHLGIQAGRNIVVNGSTLTAESFGCSMCAPGDIQIAAGGAIRVLNGSLLTGNNNGVGPAGALTIQAGTTFLGQDSSFLARTGEGHGGIITITAPDRVLLTNSFVDTSVGGSAASVGGNIAITSETVRLENSQVKSNASNGTGGTVTIRPNAFRPDDQSVVEAVSLGGGTNGTVTIEPLP